MSCVQYILQRDFLHRFIYNYMSHHDLERMKFKDKLGKDWERGPNMKKSLPVPSSATRSGERRVGHGCGSTWRVWMWRLQ